MTTSAMELKPSKASVANLACDIAFAIRCIVQKINLSQVGLEKNKIDQSLKQIIALINDSTKTISIVTPGTTSNQVLANPTRANVLRKAIASSRTQREMLADGSLADFLKKSSGGYIETAKKIISNDTVSEGDLLQFEDFCLSLADHSNSNASYSRHPIFKDEV